VSEHIARVEQLRSLVEGFARITVALGDAVSDADDAASRLHGVWSGDAAAAHRTAHDRWASDAARMNAALERLRGLLDVAGANYDSAVAANQRMWR